MDKHFCIFHGFVEVYKNGKCKVCVAVERKLSRRLNAEKKKALMKSLTLKETAPIP